MSCNSLALHSFRVPLPLSFLSPPFPLPACATIITCTARPYSIAIQAFGKSLSASHSPSISRISAVAPWSAESSGNDHYQHCSAFALHTCHCLLYQKYEPLYLPGPSGVSSSICLPSSSHPSSSVPHA